MEESLDNLGVAFNDTNHPGYNTSYEDYDGTTDLNSHPAVWVIYRVIVPIICGCGILGIILTGNSSLSYDLLNSKIAPIVSLLFSLFIYRISQLQLNCCPSCLHITAKMGMDKGNQSISLTTFFQTHLFHHAASFSLHVARKFISNQEVYTQQNTISKAKMAHSEAQVTKITKIFNLGDVGLNKPIFRWASTTGEISIFSFSLASLPRITVFFLNISNTLHLRS